MYLLIIIIFIIGYLAIALEHSIKIDKASSALLTGVLCWIVLLMGNEYVFNLDFGKNISEFISDTVNLPSGFFEFLKTYRVKADDTVRTLMQHFLNEELRHHIGEIASILFFLLGAMTIVELVDAHDGFRIITDRISTSNRVSLLWMVGIITFFMSATLDNLTTAIVMSALLKKLLKENNDLWLFGGVVIISANAGGAWTPIGDVTTIMLWIGGQVTAANIILKLFVPSILCLIVPLIFLSVKTKGNIIRPENINEEKDIAHTSSFERILVFVLGVSALLFVPVFKSITHLPPYMGILLGLAVLWIVTEIIHSSKNREEKTRYSVMGVLRKIDTPSVLFFLGILTAVAALQTSGHLSAMAKILQNNVGNIYAINIIIGILSSIIDNVPLVAGAMGMYEIGAEIPGVSYPVDHTFWEFLAYCAGTGGSCLIIGSAAGVAIMGIMKIDFMWYLKNITFLALAGYFSGALAFILMNEFIF